MTFTGVRKDFLTVGWWGCGPGWNSKLLWWVASLPQAGGLKLADLKVASNTNLSMILWFLVKRSPFSAQPFFPSQSTQWSGRGVKIQFSNCLCPNEGANKTDMLKAIVKIYT